MRLARQYREDRSRLAGRILLGAVVLALSGLLFSHAVDAFAHSYLDARYRAEDEAMLQKADSDIDDSLDQRIATRESLIPKVRDRATSQSLRRELSALYDRKGKESARAGNEDMAEFSFRRASELNPGDSTYFFEIAQLYVDQARGQLGANSRIALYRNSLDLYTRALNEERDPNRRRVISNSAAYASYNLAKIEFQMPDGHNLALQDLQRARQLVAPDTPAASDISQLILLASNQP